MITRRLAWVVGVLSISLASCGVQMALHKIPEPSLDEPIRDIPGQIRLSGQLRSVPKIKVRDLGTSRMVTLSGVAVVKMEPEIPRLAKALSFEERESVTWISPDPEGCEMTQANFAKQLLPAFQLELTFWGWDRETSACEKMLRNIQTNGLNVVLKKVGVRASAPAPHVEIHLSPP